MAHLRSAASWSTLVLAAALAAALPACGGGSKKTVEAPPAPASTLAVTCADAAAVLGPLGAAQLGKDRPDAEAVRLAVEEVVVNGETGVVAAGAAPGPVAAAVGELLADPERRRTMADAARARSRAFAMDVVAERYELHLHALLPAGGR